MLNSIQKIFKENSTPLRAIPTDIPPFIGTAPIQGIFFDVYGTLFISHSGDIGVASEKGNAFNFYQALIQSGFPSASRDSGLRAKNLFFSSIQRYHQQAKERGIEYPEVDILSIWHTVLSELTREGYVSEEFDDTTLMEIAVRYETTANRVYPMPGVREILSFLQSLTIPVGIVSNAQFYTPLLFPALLNENLTDLGFDETLCIWSYKDREAKPSVRLFQKALKQLSLSRPSLLPEDLLYVGNDMLNDIKAAGDAGFKTAFFAGDKRSCRTRAHDPRCAGCTPDFIINDLLQLKNICYIEAGP